MSSQFGFRFVLAVLFCVVTLNARSQIKPLDTTAPDEFDFVSAEYVVSEDATNAVITVRFYPGTSSGHGYVIYSTSDGTATAGQDYTAVSNVLNFTAQATLASFVVPIKMDSLSQTDETVNLTLTPAYFKTVIPRSNAVLRITNVASVPRLQIAAAANGTVELSWPDDGTHPVLEKCTGPAGAAANWSAVTTAPVIAGERCCVTDAASGAMGFYRLRKSQ